MKEKIKGILAGFIFRIIAILTLEQISPLVGTGAIIEQDGKILFIKRSDGLGYAIPGGIIRYRETVEHCVIREVKEETGYDIVVTGLVGIYSSPRRDPRFRAIALTFKGTIVSGSACGSIEGEPYWLEPTTVFGQLAFDCEEMIKDYLSGQQRLS